MRSLVCKRDLLGGPRHLRQSLRHCRRQSLRDVFAYNRAGTSAAPNLQNDVDVGRKPGNAYAQILIRAEASFKPEAFSEFGIPGYDDQTVDLGPDNAKRFRAAVAAAKAELQAKLQIEHDPNVREDLEIMITAASDEIQSSELQERLVLPWTDAPRLIFEGIHGLLSKQVAVGPQGARSQPPQALYRHDARRNANNDTGAAAIRRTTKRRCIATTEHARSRTGYSEWRNLHGRYPEVVRRIQHRRRRRGSELSRVRPMTMWAGCVRRCYLMPARRPSCRQPYMPTR